MKDNCAGAGAGLGGWEYISQMVTPLPDALCTTLAAKHLIKPTLKAAISTILRRFWGFCLRSWRDLTMVRLTDEELLHLRTFPGLFLPLGSMFNFPHSKKMTIIIFNLRIHKCYLMPRGIPTSSDSQLLSLLNRLWNKECRFWIIISKKKMV